MYSRYGHSNAMVLSVYKPCSKIFIADSRREDRGTIRRFENQYPVQVMIIETRSWTEAGIKGQGEEAQGKKGIPTGGLERQPL